MRSEDFTSTPPSQIPILDNLKFQTITKIPTPPTAVYSHAAMQDGFNRTMLKLYSIIDCDIRKFPKNNYAIKHLFSYVKMPSNSSNDYRYLCYSHTILKKDISQVGVKERYNYVHN